MPLSVPCSVAESLAAAAAAARHVEPPEPPTSQPEQIKAVLRDYQVNIIAGTACLWQPHAQYAWAVMC